MFERSWQIVRRATDFRVEDGEGVNLAAIGPRGSDGGKYFATVSNFDGFQTFLKEYLTTMNLYYTTNPVKLELGYEKATLADVTRRTALPIDLDNKKGLFNIDGFVVEAFRVAAYIRHKWIYLLRSGRNGFHLVYRFRNSDEQARFFIRTLSKKFSVVDHGTHAKNQLFRIPGTMNMNQTPHVAAVLLDVIEWEDEIGGPMDGTEYFGAPDEELMKTKREHVAEAVECVSDTCFPPCIRSLLDRAMLTDFEKYLLGTFFLRIGRSIEYIIVIFSRFLDFDETKTRNKLTNVMGKFTPSCETIKEDGTCQPTHEFCSRLKQPWKHPPKHPLQFVDWMNGRLEPEILKHKPVIFRD